MDKGEHSGSRVMVSFRVSVRLRVRICLQLELGSGSIVMICARFRFLL